MVLGEVRSGVRYFCTARPRLEAPASVTALTYTAACLDACTRRSVGRGTTRQAAFVDPRFYLLLTQRAETTLCALCAPISPRRHVEHPTPSLCRPGRFSDPRIPLHAKPRGMSCSHPLWNDVEMGTDLTTPKGDKSASEGDAAIAGATRAAVRKLGQELGIPADQLPLEDFSFLTKVCVCVCLCVCVCVCA